MTRQDFYFIMVHIGAFLLGYSAAMVTLIHGNPNYHVWFDWSCLYMGLLSTGVVSFGTNLPSNPTSNSLTSFLRLTPKMEVKETPQYPNWVKTPNVSPSSDEDAYLSWKAMNRRWVCENNPKENTPQ